MSTTTYPRHISNNVRPSTRILHRMAPLSDDQINKCATVFPKDKYFWKYISQDYSLSEDFIHLYQNELDWHSICQKQVLSEAFILKHKEKVNWMYIGMYQRLSCGFIRRFINKFTAHNICKYQELTCKFMLDFPNKIDWKTISQYQKLHDAMIEKFHDKLDWDLVSKHQNLRIALCRKFKDKINWDVLTINQDVGLPFFREFPECFDYELVFKTQCFGKQHMNELKTILKKDKPMETSENTISTQTETMEDPNLHKLIQDLTFQLNTKIDLIELQSKRISELKSMNKKLITKVNSQYTENQENKQVIQLLIDQQYK